jgi:hypothetical protein
MIQVMYRSARATNALGSQFDARGNAQLPEYVRHVSFHRSPRDEEPCSDFKVGESLRHEINHILLRLGEARPADRVPVTLASATSFHTGGTKRGLATSDISSRSNFLIGPDSFSE